MITKCQGCLQILTDASGKRLAPANFSSGIPGKKSTKSVTYAWCDTCLESAREPEIISAEYTFSLPSWVSDDHYCYEVPVYYGSGHAWAGSYSHSRYENKVYDRLFDLPLVKEVSLDPMNPWIVIELCGAPGKNTNKFLMKFRKQLINTLKELHTRGGDHGTDSND